MSTSDSDDPDFIPEDYEPIQQITEKKKKDEPQIEKISQDRKAAANALWADLLKSSGKKPAPTRKPTPASKTMTQSKTTTTSKSKVDRSTTRSSNALIDSFTARQESHTTIPASKPITKRTPSKIQLLVKAQMEKEEQMTGGGKRLDKPISALSETREYWKRFKNEGNVDVHDLHQEASGKKSYLKRKQFLARAAEAEWETRRSLKKKTK
eukprot:gnl/Dysnectes_brevis/1738_a1982_1942.p2 GENE.gnl/Dysnectes_brevis/1738_a1982_1942~~gnl/Dysnectes_brevis/1738_a1982_1942.p2  ORF type:complete len:210 (+),score=31.59 gnl/Dysnectes_brevis/1738_a1982_1942:860-1489(+)